MGGLLGIFSDSEGDREDGGQDGSSQIIPRLQSRFGDKLPAHVAATVACQDHRDYRPHLPNRDSKVYPTYRRVRFAEVAHVEDRLQQIHSKVYPSYRRVRFAEIGLRKRSPKRRGSCWLSGWWKSFAPRGQGWIARGVSSSTRLNPRVHDGGRADRLGFVSSIEAQRSGDEVRE